MTVEKRNLIAIGFGYLIFLLLFLSHFNFNPSATIGLSERHMGMYDGQLPHGLVILHNDGFDGQYYYYMARNPGFSDIRSIPPNFLQRIAYPTSARMISLGFDPFMPVAFLLINLCAALLSSLMLMRLLKKYGASENLAFLWAFSAGIMLSLSANLTELPMICLVLAALYFYERQRTWISIAALSLAVMTRETALTFVVAFVLYFVLQKRFRSAAAYALAAVPFLIWQRYFLYAYGTLPIQRSSQAVSMPSIGQAVRHASTTAPSATEPATTFLSILAENTHRLLDIVGSSALSLYEKLAQSNQILSPWPVLCFTIVIAFMLVFRIAKDRKIGMYAILLSSQISFMCIINPGVLLNEGIEATGRYAIGMITISLLFFAERGKRYARILAFLIMASAIAYFFQRTLVPKADYHISMPPVDFMLG